MERWRRGVWGGAKSKDLSHLLPAGLRAAAAHEKREVLRLRSTAFRSAQDDSVVFSTALRALRALTTAALVALTLPTTALAADPLATLPSRTGLILDGEPIVAEKDTRDRGVRLLDLNHDGRAEVLVANETQRAVFEWSDADKLWKRLPYGLPAPFVDAQGRDAGLRLVDLNGDGFVDALYSGADGFSVHLFVPVEKKGVDWKLGWSLEMRAGKRGEPGEIPLLAGRDVQFRDGAMFVEGARIPYEDLLREPPPPPKSPADSLAAIRVAEGFTVELVASEPLVMDPVAFEWGADGRLWVLEMGDYPLGVDDKGKPGGVVRVLEDTDGDGRYDKATALLEGLPFPSGLMPWRRGVLVAAAPDLFYAEDTDGDGRADRREVLFTGFTEGNQQHRINGFDQGLDGWLYAANGDSGGTIRSAKTGATIELGARDLRFRPDDGALELQPGRTQYGRHRDDWGRWFGGNNSTWAWHYFLPEHYLARNPQLSVKETRRVLAAYPDAPRVFPISAPQRRFNWPTKTNALTSGCSITPYRDDLFGADFVTSLFICEPVNNLVHREVLTPDGVTFTSRRAKGDEQREFLASADNWSRFSFARTGPDGALYIADMYRHVIEHPQWIPEEQIKRLDLRAGHDRGRIYRVFPTGAKLRQIPRLDRIDTAGLVAALDSANGWQRDTAQRLLLDSRDKAATAPLAALVEKNARPQTRLQSLCTLDALGALDAGILEKVLRDPHPAVRENAVRLSESFLRAAPAEDSALTAALLSLADDRETRVRYQLAFTLGEWNDPRAGIALAKLARRDADDAQVQLAIMSSAPRHLASLLEALIADPGNPPPAALVEHLLTLAATDEKLATSAVYRIGVAGGGGFADWQYVGVSGWLDGLARAGKSAPPTLLQELGPMFEQAARTASSRRAPEPDRLATIRLLGRGPRRDEELRTLAALLTPADPAPIQSAALASLARDSRAETAALLTAGWNSYSPALRIELLGALLRRTEWASALLDSIGAGQIPAREIDVSTRQKLLAHSDAKLRERAGAIFATTHTDRAKVVQSYAGVDDLTGDATRGATVFQQHCAVCHRLRGVGSEVGPDLAMLADKPAAHFLEAIFDPNKAVESRYLGFTVVTKNDRTLLGIVASESPTSVVFRSPGGAEESILRSDIRSITSSSASLMPEGFEATLKPQDVADLIAFMRASPGAK